MSSIETGSAEADEGKVVVSSLLHNWGLGEDGTPNTASLSIHWKDELDTPLLVLSYNECKNLIDALDTAMAAQEESMAEEGMQISKMGRYISIEEDWDDTPSEKDAAHYWAESMRIEKWKQDYACYQLHLFPEDISPEDFKTIHCNARQAYGELKKRGIMKMESEEFEKPDEDTEE